MIVLSQLHLAHLYYLELSLTVLQNYQLCESRIKFFETPKNEKKTTKNNNKSTTTIDIYVAKKYIRDILGISSFAAPGLQSTNVTANLKFRF